MMRTLTIAGGLATVLIVACLSQAPAADSGRELKPAHDKMKIFQLWVGDWNEEAEFANGLKVKAKGKNRFVLGGHYLQSRFVIQLRGGRKLENLAMFGWDATTKEYRGWMFSSSGRSHATVGKWDAKKKELVTTSGPDAKGVKTKTITRIVGKDKLQWEVVQITKQGKVVPLVKGVDTRVKG